MSRVIAPSRRALSSAALLASVGFACNASAADKHWLCNTNSVWSTVSCWSPAGAPGATDSVHIGSVAGVHNTSVLLDVNASIGNLFITDGMTLDTNGSTLNTNVVIDVSGRNTVGLSSFPSRLVVDQIIAGPEVSAGLLDVHNGGQVELFGGGLSIDSLISIGATSSLRGAGSVSVISDFVNFRNDGVIAPTGAMYLSQSGSGLYDLDGVSGAGVIELTASNAALTVAGDGIFEAFGGSVSMARGSLLQMNLSDHWTVENSGQFNIYGSGVGAPPRIAGAPIHFGGTINLYSGSRLTLDASISFNTGAELITGSNVIASINSAADIASGLFTINQGSSLDLNGPTSVHAGAFITPTDVPADGAVNFNGPTTWAGAASFAGFARQNGAAHVTASTIISADTFDMDGSNSANWDIDAPLTVNADHIDPAGDSFSNTLDIAGAGRIAVNLSNPFDYWAIDGVMNLAGNSLLFSTRVGAGSPLWIIGEVNVSGKNDIATSVLVSSNATINLPTASSALRFMDNVLLGAGTTFTGAGLLQVGGPGLMITNSGLNTGSVGINNTGELRVGSGPGIASVGRFLTSGLWTVDIAGHTAGTEFDRIISTGPATVSGDLHVNLDPSFTPAVGDTFTILIAAGDVTGAFDPNIVSTSHGATYHWESIITAHEITLRLASIQPPCRADFNLDSVVNSQDFFDFLTAFFAGSARADINADGAINSQDFFDFLIAFFAGC